MENENLSTQGQRSIRCQVPLIYMTDNTTKPALSWQHRSIHWIVVILWFGTVAVPICGAIENGAGFGTYAQGCLYVLGLWALWRGYARHIKTEGGSPPFGYRAVKAGACIGMIFALIVGLADSWAGGLGLILIVGWFPLLLWGLSATTDKFAQRIGQFTLMFLSLLFCAGIGELFFRLPAVVRRTGGTHVARARFADDHYDHLWENQPYRLRSYHLEKPKPKGVKRIVVLGDSFSWGDKIWKTGQTWPYVMEVALRWKGYGNRIQVLNLAQPGFTTTNSREMLEKMAWQFEPDLIVLQFSLNDPLRGYPNYKNVNMKDMAPTNDLPFNWLVRNSYSYLWTYLNDRYHSEQRRFFYPDGYASLYDDDYSGWQECKQAIAAMAQQTKSRDVPMALMIFPTFRHIDLSDKGYLFLDEHAKVTKAARDAGLQVLDLRKTLANTNPNGLEWWALPWDAHPNARAHSIAGKTLTDHLESWGMLKNIFEQNTKENVPENNNGS
jgi:hypothetical protein